MAKSLSKSSSSRISSHTRLPAPYLCPVLLRHQAKTSPERHLYTSSTPLTEYLPQQPKYPQERPRWQQTPPRMTAPYRSKPPVMDNEFEVNEDPVRLNRVYENVLGRGGDRMLTEEVKWLAVTHKSFDHGRRGYNDRLSFLGTIMHTQKDGSLHRLLALTCAQVGGLSSCKPRWPSFMAPQSSLSRSQKTFMGVSHSSMPHSKAWTR